MKIGFDLDGTLYDNLPIIFRIHTKVREILGYLPNSLDEYKRTYQSRDWRKLYRDLGVREQDIDEAIRLFVHEYAKEGHPEIIPGAHPALCGAEQAVGRSHIYIVTQERPDRVQRRFERDGLIRFLDNVDYPFEGKANEIYRLATLSAPEPFVYVGDLVSDGEACLEARTRGAVNVRFFGMTHPPAFNPAELMLDFINRHSEFARELPRLEEIERIWNHR